VAREKELIGRRIGGGRFEIFGLLGSGAFAEVYRGRQLALNRDVAIKILNEWDAQDAQLVKRFHHEAEAIARFEHPHIVRIYDHGEEEELHYYVMNLLPRSLRSFLAKPEPLPIPFTLRLACQLASALDYAQRTVENFVHRDIKPENIMLDRDDNAVLSDFGLVRGEEFSRMTVDGAIMGTPAYMAPEQWRGETPDGRTDLYALGIMLYECATGFPPFRGELLAVCHQHVNKPPQPPRQCRPELSPELEAIILRLLEKAPEKRYASAAALMAALSRLGKDSLIQPTASLVTQTLLPTSLPEPKAVERVIPERTQTIVSAEAGLRDERRRRTWRRALILSAGIILAIASLVFLQIRETLTPESKPESPADSSSVIVPSSSSVITPPFQPKPQLVWLRITSKPPSEILVDGVSHGLLAAGKLSIEISPGQHELAFRHPTYGSVTKTVDVRERVGLDYVFEWLGKVMVVAIDEKGEPIRAAIFRDDQPTNDWTPYELELPVGRYKIRVNKFEYEVLTPPQTVQIKGGDQVSLQFVLRRIDQDDR
jgi:serine/threonine protein kinase